MGQVTDIFYRGALLFGYGKPSIKRQSIFEGSGAHPRSSGLGSPTGRHGNHMELTNFGRSGHPMAFGRPNDRKWSDERNLAVDGPLDRRSHLRLELG